MSAHDQDSNIPNFSYGPSDFILQCPTWEAFKSNPELSEFDQLLGRRWEQAMADGVFNYKFDVSQKQQRMIPGKHRYVISLQLSRARQRRTPQFIENVNKPFDADKFHFNKVKPAEIIMNMCEVPDTEQGSEGVPTQNGTADISDKEPEQMKGKHMIVINNSPFEYGHVLLTPDVDLCIPQRITLRGLKVAIEMMLLSRHPGLRVCFNGLCAMASVNHQHLHGWYGDTPLLIETTPVDHIAGLCYETRDFVAKGFIFQLHGTTLEELTRAVFTLTDHLQQNEIAHNLYMTRGTVFGESPDSKLTTVRVVVWPRQKHIGSKQLPGSISNIEVPVFHVAVAELAGQIPMYREDRYDNLTEAEIIDRIKGSLLSDEEFGCIRDAVKKLMTAQNGCS